MVGTKAVIKLPGGAVKAYSLDGKAPSAIKPLTSKQFPVHDIDTEVIAGYVAMKFSVHLTDAQLESTHLVFAGGKGNSLGYHGSIRGHFTLDLLGTHYDYHQSPPPSPPLSTPRHPAPPSCYLDGTVESVTDNLPCSANIASGVELEYALDSTHLRANVRCEKCRAKEWIGVGFPVISSADNQAGQIFQGTSILGFPATSSGEMRAWSLKNLALENGNMVKKLGRGKGYDGIATSGEPNAIEVAFTGPAKGGWFRICFTPNKDDSVKCEKGSSMGLHPKMRIMHGCKGGKWTYKRVNYKEGDQMSVRFDPGTQAVDFRKGAAVVASCPTTDSGLYAKVFIWRRNTFLPSVNLVTSTQAGAMVSKYGLVGAIGGKVIHFIESAPKYQTLTATTAEAIDGGVTMAFTARLGEEGIPTDFHAASFLFAHGEATSFGFNTKITAGDGNWSMMTLKLLDTTLPPSPAQLPAVPSPPPPTCDSSSLAGIAGYPCTTQLGRMFLFYYLDSTELKARLHCPACRGWLALGFAASPNSMIGATAIIGNHNENGIVAVHYLGGKSVSQVETNVGASLQLRNSRVETASSGGITMYFTATLGTGGVPSSLSTADLLYAAGNSRKLGYHGGFRGGARVKFVTMPPSAPPLGLVNERYGQAGNNHNDGGGGGSDITLVGVLCAMGGFVAGAVLVASIVVAIRNKQDSALLADSKQKCSSTMKPMRSRLGLRSASKEKGLGGSTTVSDA